MPQRPESILEGKNRPFTGAEFLNDISTKLGAPPNE